MSLSPPTDSVPSTSAPPFSFQVNATVGQARAGTFKTPHGVIETPVFMPVGTHSTVKTLTMDQVRATEAQIILGNAYHLYLRPGHERVARAGGLHRWMDWNRPILTDSGGFQVFSLAQHRKLEPNGVRFKDPTTGDTHFIGPEKSMEIQNALGADIIMAFDECPPYPVSETDAAQSLDLTQHWLEGCLTHHQRPEDQALFPIVQGSTYEHLRERSAAFVNQLDTVGCAIGGVSVGEPRDVMHRVTRFTAPLLPAHKPRYLMGVGTPEDLLDGIQAGVDLFDCVMPTRVARHGAFFTPTGRKNIRNAQFEDDLSPLVAGCRCYTCQHHHRAYVRHLFRQGESTAKTLLSLHNLVTLIDVVQGARRAILDGTFEDFHAHHMARLFPDNPAS